MEFTFTSSRPPFDYEVTRRPHFLKLHDTHEHVTADGENFHAISPDIALKHLVANLNNRAKFDAIACALGSSSCGIFEKLLREGERDPSKIFEVTGPNHILKDEAGATHLRIRYDFIYCHSRDHQRDLSQPEHAEGCKGGQHSKDQMESLTSFLADIGLEVNHERVKAETCQGC